MNEHHEILILNKCGDIKSLVMAAKLWLQCHCSRVRVSYLLVRAFVHLILLWSWMLHPQLIRWLVVFVCNALTWYSSPPPFNLFGPEPTLNAQIASFHKRQQCQQGCASPLSPRADPWVTVSHALKRRLNLWDRRCKVAWYSSAAGGVLSKAFSFIYSAVRVCL